MSGFWPLRYRIAHRFHCAVNRVHVLTGERSATLRLNDWAASFWVPWWIGRGRKG